MDVVKLVQIFKATIDPNQRESAEQQLDQVNNNGYLCLSLCLIVLLLIRFIK